MHSDVQRQSTQFSIESILNDSQKPDLTSHLRAASHTNGIAGNVPNDNDLLFDKIRDLEDNSNLKKKLTEDNKIKYETVETYENNAKKPQNSGKHGRIKNVVIDARTVEEHLHNVGGSVEDKPPQNRSQR